MKQETTITLDVELGNTIYEVEFYAKYQFIEGAFEGHGFHTETIIDWIEFEFYFDDPNNAVCDMMHDKINSEIEFYQDKFAKKIQ